MINGLERGINMTKATKIKMKYGCHYSDNVLEIDQVYLEGLRYNGYYKKEDIHDYLKNNPNTIVVNIYPYPYVIPAESVYGEKYVKSEPDSTNKDNLLRLPRE